MTTSMPVAHEHHAGTDAQDGKRPFINPEGMSATVLVALVALVVLFGIALPALLVPAVALAVLAAIVALEVLLPTGELRVTTRRKL
jgi:hypothetical protein